MFVGEIRAEFRKGGASPAPCQVLEDEPGRAQSNESGLDRKFWQANELPICVFYMTNPCSGKLWEGKSSTKIWIRLSRDARWPRVLCAGPLSAAGRGHPRLRQDN